MADGAATACVCVLFYGSDDTCFTLAQRVLNAPMRQLASQNVEFRFGCNAVSEKTWSFLQTQIAECFHNAQLFHSRENIQKYPMMRQMLYQPKIKAPITIWFDDDSCFAPENDSVTWLSRLQRQLAYHACVGSIYRTRLSGNQAAWIQAQPWYAGKELSTYVNHVAGSWWAAKTDILYQYDWPPESKTHRGVDVMFGELCRQQNLVLCHFRDGVWINANADGVEAAGSRRGKDELPIGHDYAP